MKELETGVQLSDRQTGETYGMSQVAAKTAITNTLQSRVAYIIPIFFIPFFFNMAMMRLGLMATKGTLLNVVQECTGVGLGLYIAMPINCALYP